MLEGAQRSRPMDPARWLDDGYGRTSCYTCGLAAGSRVSRLWINSLLDRGNAIPDAKRP
jgi:hypothetical protein